MKRHTRAARGAVILAALAPAALGLTLPCTSTFDTDTLAMPPTLGVPNAPTSIYKHDGAEPDPLVVASSLGIATRPVEFAIPADAPMTAMLLYDFEPNVPTLVRAEATVSLSQHTHAIVMRSWMNSVGLVLGDIIFTDDGKIFGHGAQLGLYAPGAPVRIRMDVNIITGRYSARVDDELNGFADDPLITGLTFSNDPSLVTNVGGIGVGYIRSTAGPAATLAVDDVLIMEIPSPGALALFGVAAATAARRRR